MNYLKIKMLVGLVFIFFVVSFVVFKKFNKLEDLRSENIIALQASNYKAECEKSIEFTGSYNLPEKEKFTGGGNLVIIW